MVPLSPPQYVLEAPSTPDLKFSSVEPEVIVGKYHTVAEYHAHYRSGELTPLAVAKSLLPLVKRDATPQSVHSTAFIDSRTEIILAAAQASTERYKAGKPLSILDGIPIAIKDDSDVAGYRTTSGRKKDDTIFKVAKESAWPVQKLEEAGCIILGKLNMHEIGADTTNLNPNWGTPRNPHNPQYYTGGSSGGAAYAVSSGLIPFAFGSDGGGSIRIPSSFCGIYGLKTSHHRLEDLGSTVTVNGPLAATMADLAAAYRIMAIPNPAEPTCSLFSPPLSTPLSASKPKVIGIYKPWFNRADPSVLNICNDAVTYYREKLGYQVVDIYIPYCPEGQIAHAFTILCEMATMARKLGTSTSHEGFSSLTPANKVLLCIGEQVPARDYLLAQQLRNMLMQHLSFLYQKYPGLIIVTPTTPMPGWPINNESDLTHGFSDGNRSIRNMEYVWLANFCGNPAISCPVGYVDPKKGEGKVPVGLMGMGEWGSEDLLIGWGKEAERYLEEYPGGRLRRGNWEDVVANARAASVGVSAKGVK